MSARPAPPRRLWWLVVGFGVWCSALVFLYALHAIGCAFAWPTGIIRLLLAVLLLAHLALIGWLWREISARTPEPAHGETGAFLHVVGLWTLAAAVVATVATFAPPLLLSACV